MNPEALVIYPRQEASFQILSDDGSVKINGQKCKDVDAGRRKFRSRWLSLP